MKAKEAVKALDSRFRVRCFKHVDWHDEVVDGGEHRKATYFISAEAWRGYSLAPSAA